MPSWSKEFYADYLARHKPPSPKPEQNVPNAPDGKNARKAINAGRILVRVTSYRFRLLDPDNLCPKYFIDCLRYAEIIPNDREEDISLEVRQVKVNRRGEERTEIQVITPDPPEATALWNIPTPPPTAPPDDAPF